MVKQSVKTMEILQEEEGQRIDNFLLRHLKGVPRTRLYRLLRKGEVRVNKGRIGPSYRLQAGDVVRIPPVRVPEKPELARPGNRIIEILESSILYEDDSLMAVNKPSGLAVHGGSGLSYGLIEALRIMRPKAKSLELVHRLDRETSGCILIAKKRSMLRYLHEQMRSGKILKSYQLLVCGEVSKKTFVAEAPLKKNTIQSGERMVRVDPDGKYSLTRFRCLQTFSGYSHLEARLETGRTHQIRVHCQWLGHPIAGDDKYGDNLVNRRLVEMGLKRLFLHASRLVIRLDGHEEPLSIESDLPEELSGVIKQL